MLLVVAALAALPALAAAQAARANGAGAAALAALQPADALYGARAGAPCAREFRALDGSCTSAGSRVWGSTRRPQRALRAGSSARFAGAALPSARAVSNAVCAQARDVLNARGVNELAVFFAQFLDHNIVATPVMGAQVPIAVAPNDAVFGNFSAGLPFERSERALFDDGVREGPINTLSSVLDLSAVYGSDVARSDALRAFRGGLLSASGDGMLQFNSRLLRNAPSNDPKYYVAGDHRANEHPVLTALHTIFMREHNRLCAELAAALPDWDDHRLFQMARKINGAQFQKIVFEELYPALTGRRLPPYRGHDPSVDPTVSAVFSTAAFRVGHTMIPNQIKRLDTAMAPMPAVAMPEMFFRVENVATDGVEPFLRGSAFYTAQEVDAQVHDVLRNFLFTGIRHEEGFDLVALNIQRGRDHGLPSYNQVRVIFNQRAATSFADITANLNVQSALASVYTTPDRIDAWVGLVCEDHERGSSMGPTMLAIWEWEFQRMRDGDRFFYEIPNLFDDDVIAVMPRLRDLKGEWQTLKDIIVRNSRITYEELPSEIFYTGSSSLSRWSLLRYFSFGRHARRHKRSKRSKPSKLSKRSRHD